VSKTYFLYYLNATLKDMSTRTILPEMRTKESYLYIERLIEDYLGIKNRKMSSETNL